MPFDNLALFFALVAAVCLGYNEKKPVPVFGTDLDTPQAEGGETACRVQKSTPVIMFSWPC